MLSLFLNNNSCFTSNLLLAAAVATWFICVHVSASKLFYSLFFYKFAIKSSIFSKKKKKTTKEPFSFIYTDK